VPRASMAEAVVAVLRLHNGDLGVLKAACAVFAVLYAGGRDVDAAATEAAVRFLSSALRVHLADAHLVRAVLRALAELVMSHD
jgi:hypothetical protein